MNRKRVAVLTSGGDAPGMNNAIRSIVKYAKVKGMETFLVFGGYEGLYKGDIRPAADYNVEDHITRGGTFIGTKRFPDFKKPEIREEAKKKLKALNIDALIVIGGDGSYQGAQLLHEIGVKTIALPGTIDNDITSSDATIGYSTALNTIVDAVDKVRDTMESHERVGIIEVMGHGCGDLALFSSLATGAEIVVTNEIRISKEELGALVKAQVVLGKKSIIVIVSEFIYEDIHDVAKTVEKISGKVTRGMALEHIQRGGVPTARERIDASLMSIKAIDMLSEDKSGFAIGIIAGEPKATPILEALAIPRINRVELTEKINKINQV